MTHQAYRDHTDPAPLVAPDSAPLHPLSWLAIPLMLVIGVGGPCALLVALAWPLFAR